LVNRASRTADKRLPALQRDARALEHPSEREAKDPSILRLALPKPYRCGASGT